MTAISYFSRQAIQSRLGNRGQATALFLVTSVLILSLVFSAIYISHQGVLKIASANCRRSSLSVQPTVTGLRARRPEGR